MTSSSSEAAGCMKCVAMPLGFPGPHNLSGERHWLFATPLRRASVELNLPISPATARVCTHLPSLELRQSSWTSSSKSLRSKASTAPAGMRGLIASSVATSTKQPGHSPASWLQLDNRSRAVKSLLTCVNTQLLFIQRTGDHYHDLSFGVPIYGLNLITHLMAEGFQRKKVTFIA